MLAVLWKVALSVSFIEFLFGFLFNLFILSVNFMDWRKNTALGLCDKILVIIAFNNILLQSDMSIFTNIFMFFPSASHSKVLWSTLTMCMLFQFYSSFWVTCCLCVYYCLSIVSFNHHLLIRMKVRISMVISGMLLVSGVGSLAMSILSAWCVNIGYKNHMGNGTSSVLTTNMVIVVSPTYKAMSVVFVCGVPFVLSFLSATLVLVSLWVHTTKMKQSSPIFNTSRLVAHVRASRIIIILTLFFVEFYVAFVVLLTSSTTFDTSWEFTLLLFILIYPTMQSSVLIVGNTKLRHQYRRIFRTCRTDGVKENHERQTM